MKNIEFEFGYNGESRYSKFTYWLCNKLPFIPILEVRLFSCFKGGERKGQPYRIRHTIYIGIFKYYFRWQYSLRDKKWYFTNLTGE